MNQRSGTTADGREGVGAWLIHRAARAAPASLSQRLEEEWLADLATRPSTSSRLRFAIGCCWATRVIAQEHHAFGLAPTTAVAGPKVLVNDARHTLDFLSRRTMTLMLVVCLHAVFFYVLLTKLSHTVATAIPPPLQNHLLQEPHLRDLPPPPPPLPLDRPKQLDLKVPEFPHAEPDADQIVPREAEHPVPPTEPPPVRTSPVVQQVQGGPGAGFPNPDDFYPAFARRREQQGTATVRVCVDAQGRLTAQPTTVQGTGSADLDAGALKLASAGSGHYRASTEDGKPVASCYPFRIRFQLKN